MAATAPLASDIHTGGRNVSISMLSTWHRCPRLWYWQYLHPSQNQLLRGIEPAYTKDYLLVGSAVHAGLAAYYISGYTDGNYLIGAALDDCRAYLATRASESPSEEQHASVEAESLRILTAYAKEYGPDASCPEWPNFRVACDDAGLPLIERTFTHTLRTGHILTVRPDMIAENFGSLVCCEHKVPAAQSVSRTLGEARLGGQGLAQEAILAPLGIHTNGQLINVLVRGRVAKTRPFQREVVAHDPWAVAQLLELAARTCEHIVDVCAEWNMLCNDYGFAPVDAARKAFPMVGTLSGHCVGKFGPCTAFNLCASSGREAAMLSEFRTRTYHSDTPSSPAVE